MDKEKNESPIEQAQKHKEYISPQVENYLAFRLAKKSFMIIITTIGLLTALIGYLGIDYTNDLKQKLEKTKLTIATFKDEIFKEGDKLNKEISSFHDRMDEELKKYENLSDRYEKSLSALEMQRTNLDQQMNIIMTTFINNINASTKTLYKEISGINELNEKSKELIKEHEKLKGELGNFKKELENGQKEFIDVYSPRINKILESQIIWIRQDIAERKGGFNIEDKNLVIRFKDITVKGNNQRIIGLGVHCLDRRLIKTQQILKVGEMIEFRHPETKENYILELKLIIDNLFDNDYAGIIIRTKK